MQALFVGEYTLATADGFVGSPKDTTLGWIIVILDIYLLAMALVHLIPKCGTYNFTAPSIRRLRRRCRSRVYGILYKL